jgi:O-antigen ligase
MKKARIHHNTTMHMLIITNTGYTFDPMAKAGIGQLSLYLKTSSVPFLLSLARVSLGITLVLIPFRLRLILLARSFPPIYGDYTDFLIFASDMSLLVTLGLWLVSLILKPRRVAFGPLFLTIPIAGFTTIGWLSSFASIDIPLSLYHSIRLFLLLGMYLFIINEIHSLGQVIIPITTMTFIQAVTGIIQVLKQGSLGLYSLGELPLNPNWNGVSIVSAEGIRSLRAYGLTDHPNILGGCLAFAMVLIACWYINPEAKWRSSLSAIFSLGALALLFTFSRSAWLALMAGSVLIVSLVIRSKQRTAIQALPGLATSTVIILVPFILLNASFLGVRINWHGSFQSAPQENQSIGERKLLNKAANEIFVEHALIGTGLGAFPRALQVRNPEFRLNYQPAHMTLLDVAAEIGIFGALFYAIAMTAPWLALWLNRKRLTFSPELLGVIGLLLAVSVVGFFDYYTWLLAPGRLWQWLAWGLWGSIYRYARGTHE